MYKGLPHTGDTKGLPLAEFRHSLPEFLPHGSCRGQADSGASSDRNRCHDTASGWPGCRYTWVCSSARSVPSSPSASLTCSRRQSRAGRQSPPRQSHRHTRRSPHRVWWRTRATEEGTDRVVAVGITSRMSRSLGHVGAATNTVADNGVCVTIQSPADVRRPTTRSAVPENIYRNTALKTSAAEAGRSD